MINDSSITSDQLTNAYRTWDAEVKNSASKNPYIVCVDDLSSLDRTASTSERANIDSVLSIFKQATQEAVRFPRKNLLKVENSIAFMAAADSKPTKLAIESCGGFFEPISEDTIRDLTKEIRYLEQQPSYQFETVDATNSTIFAQNIISSGYEYLSSKIEGLLPLAFRFEEPRIQNPFGAQVVTDERGCLVCQIPQKLPVNSLFYLTIIHEILGHVLHFTHLRSSAELQSQSHLLCLSNHTHESFFIEAIAQLITTYLVQESSWPWPHKKSLYLADLKYHRNQTIAHLLMTQIVEGNIVSREAAKAHLDLCLQEGPSDDLAIKYQNVASNLFSLKVALNYSPSFNAIKPLLTKDEEDFFPIFSKMIYQYFTPDSLKLFVEENP